MANNLNLVVELILKNKAQLDAVIGELKEKHGIDIDTKEADASIENLKNTTQDAGAKNSNFAQTVTAISTAYMAMKQIVGQVKAALDGLVNTYQAQEKSDNNLLNSLKQKSTEYDKLFDSLSKEADAIQRVTMVGDEAAQKLMSAGLNMGIAITKVADATEGAIGLSTKFEAVGMSQETAMKGIALAYEGDFTQLQRYIPALKAAETESEKMTILQEQMVTGFELATAEIETTYGAMQQLENETGDLNEQLGEQLAPALLKVQKGFLDVTKSLLDMLNLADFEGEAFELMQIAAIQESIAGYTKDQLKLEQELVTNNLIKNGAIIHNLQQVENLNEVGKQRITDLQAENQLLIQKGTILDEELTKIAVAGEESLARAKDLAAQIGEDLKAGIKIELDTDKLITDEDEDIITENMDELLVLRQDFRERDYDLNTEHLQQKLDAIDNYYIANHDKLIEAGITEEQILAQQEQAKALIKASYKKKELKVTAKFFGDMAKIMKSTGKEGFEAYKAFAIIQATIDAYSSASAAYKSALAIPVIGLGFAPVAAAAAFAAGMINVKEIAAQKFTGGGIAQGTGGEDSVNAKLTPGEVILNAAQQKNLVSKLTGSGNSNELLGSMLNVLEMILSSVNNFPNKFILIDESTGKERYEAWLEDEAEYKRQMQ
jgi:hypothetical protein